MFVRYPGCIERGGGGVLTSAGRGLGYDIEVCELKGAASWRAGWALIISMVIRLLGSTVNIFHSKSFTQSGKFVGIVNTPVFT